MKLKKKESSNIGGGGGGGCTHTYSQTDKGTVTETTSKSVCVCKLSVCERQTHGVTQTGRDGESKLANFIQTQKQELQSPRMHALTNLLRLHLRSVYEHSQRRPEVDLDEVHTLRPTRSVFLLPSRAVRASFPAEVLRAAGSSSSIHAAAETALDAIEPSPGND